MFVFNFNLFRNGRTLFLDIVFQIQICFRGLIVLVIETASQMINCKSKYLFICYMYNNFQIREGFKKNKTNRSNDAILENPLLFIEF